MGDSASLSARSSSDLGILDRARQLKNGALIERIQALHRKKTALKGTKDGLDKFKGASLPGLRTIADYPKFDEAVRAALRPKRAGESLWAASLLLLIPNKLEFMRARSTSRST